MNNLYPKEKLIGSWIPCIKRLPPAQEPDGHGAENYSSIVQISTDCNIVTDAWYCFSDHTWYKSGFRIIGRVVDWQPLPESYKDNKSRKEQQY